MNPLCWIAAACLLATATRSLAGADNETLDIYWIDSMGGGSTLIVTPAGESILIDTGNPGGRDAGRIHQVATEVAGLRKIDHLVVTHLHVDHYGGAPELSQRIPIGQVYDNGVPDRSPDGNNDPAWPIKIRPYREMKAGGRTVVMPGAKIPLRPTAVGPAVTATFVAAQQRFANTPAGSGEAACKDPNPKAADTSDNANSVVTLIQFGSFRFFNGGDLTWNTEAGLVCPLRQTGSVDVYQVNHHGLDVSNNPLLLAALAPTVAVFNNGPRKGCMPAPAAALRALPSVEAIYQVHRNLVAPNANAPAEFCANNGETGGNYIHLQVAKDSRHYTVSVPSTQHRRTFATRL